jgi:hypothetical protein
MEGEGNSLSAEPKETMGFQEKSWRSTIADQASRSAWSTAGKGSTQVDKRGALRTRQWGIRGSLGNVPEDGATVAQGLKCLGAKRAVPIGFGVIRACVLCVIATLYTKKLLTLATKTNK